MILKLVLLGLLAAAAAHGSSIKGLQREESALKGDRQLASPIEYQRRREFVSEQRAEFSKTKEEVRELTKSQALEQQRVELSKTQESDERREEQLQVAEQKVEELSQQREEATLLTQQKEELAPPTKSIRLEPRPKLTPDVSKGQKSEEKHEESHKAPAKSSPQKTAEEPKPSAVEQQRDTTNFYEQQQQQQMSQQVELRDWEQRRLEDQQVQVQQFEEQRAIGIKGGAPSAQVAEPEPYAFDYSIEGSSRRESGDTNGVVRGQYTLQQPDGTSRIVDYIADRNGFRASVSTNEFGTESGSPANVELRSSQPAAQDISLRLEGKTREHLAPPAVKGAPVVRAPARPENWNVKGDAQEQVVQLEESKAIKGVKLVEQPAEVKAPLQAPAPAPLPLVAAQAPLKEAQLVENVDSAQVQTFEAPTEQSVIKSAEVREPKALAIEPKSAAAPKARYSFESATAHRPVVGIPRREIHLVRETPLVGHVTYLQRVAPAVTRNYAAVQQARVHHQRPQSAASVLRSQLQYDRYPPVPAHGHATRGERPFIPRVSFYSNNAESSEDLPLGFEAS